MDKLIDSEGNILEVGDTFRIHYIGAGFGDGDNAMGTLREVVQYLNGEVETKYTEIDEHYEERGPVSYYNTFKLIRESVGQQRFRFE